MKYFQFNKKKYLDIYSPGQDLKPVGRMAVLRRTH